MPASITPTIVIPAPLAHHNRVVTSAFDAPTTKWARGLMTNDAITAPHDGVVRGAFDAPTTKWARVLMTNDAITAGMPTVKKNGMIGMKPPLAVDTDADSIDRHGFGNVSAFRPSSSWTSVRRNCFGSFCRRSAIDLASVGEKPLSW